MEDPEKDKTTSEQSNSDESEPTDQQVADQDDDAGQAADDQPEDVEGKEEKPNRDERRHERYIDKLSAEIRDSNSQSERYTELTPTPYKPLEIKDGESYTPQQLEEDRKKAEESSFAKGLNQGMNQGNSRVEKELWADRFEIDSERVTTKWDALNPDKPNDYDEKLEASLVQKYIQFAGVTKDSQGRVSIEKPNVRFKDFVEAEMRNLEEYASRRGAQASRNVKSQAAKTAIRPTGQSRPSKGGHGFDPNDPVGSVNRMTKKQYFDLGGKEASDAYLAERGLAPAQK